MATATPLKDIDEQFLQCCICKEQLKEPKILPCLHKYCQECLKKFAKEEAKTIECVTCREQHTLPEDGIDGLRTDFITENIMEFIQLQDSVKLNPLRNCIHCNENLKASAFCFRCNDFLCETCHEFHASSLIVKDHQPHTFSMREAGVANLTIQKLSSLKEAPRCHAHPGKPSELCCTTCDNLPVCVPCTYGEHRGHNLTEVTSLAKNQREMLRGEVVDLMQYKEEAYQMPEEIRKIEEKLDHNVKGEELKRQEQLDAEEGRIKKAITNAEEELKRKQAVLEGEVKAKTLMRKKDLEEKIEKLREGYELFCEEERCKADASFKKLQEENKKETEQLQEGLRVVNSEFKELLTSLKVQKDEQSKKIKELSDHIDGIVKRFETVTTTVNCIRAAEDDWADVQCIPDVCRAIHLLSEDVRKSSEGLWSLSVVKVRGWSPAVTVRRNSRISKDVESVVLCSGQFNFRLDVVDVAAFPPKPKEKPPVKFPAVKYPGLNESVEYYQSDERDDLHFEPVVTLPKNVKLETGEEGEQVRFEHRAKLYRWDRESSQWKERGVGDIKVLFNPETTKYRLVMRREQVLKVCANHFITEQVDLQPNAGSDRSWVWHAMDFSDGEVRYEQLAARFKTGDAAKDFKDAVDAAKKDS